MKLVILLLLIMSSCASHDLGYRSHPLPGAYYPRRYHLHAGPITFIDLQIVRK